MGATAMNKANSTLTQSRLKEILDYDPVTGIFVWATEKRYGLKAGYPAGTKNAQGYIDIQIDEIKHKAHRLAWLYCYGELPKKNIDHINQSRDDNAITNLREANHSENGQNRSINKSNTSGFRNVSYAKNYKKWCCYLRLRGKVVYSSYFDSAEEASKAVEQKRKELFTHNT